MKEPRAQGCLAPARSAAQAAASPGPDSSGHGSPVSALPRAPCQAALPCPAPRAYGLGATFSDPITNAPMAKKKREG